MRSSIKSILAHRLHPRPVMMCLPISSFDSSRYTSGEPGISGIVDLIKWEMWKWETSPSTSNPKPSCHPLPRRADAMEESILSGRHPLLTELIVAREAIIDSLCVQSPDLLNRFLSLDSPHPYLALPDDEVLKAVRKLTQTRQILPVLCGAALKHVGTNLLLDYVGELLASPLDTIPLEAGGALTGAGSAQRRVTSLAEAELQALAWKVTWDNQRGWMTFVRIYSGKN